MCSYERLVQDANTMGLEIVEKNFKSNAKGLCKGQKIGIRKNMSEIEKACILAEEIGHYYTTTGNILNQKDADNRKQELKARKWAIEKMISIEDLFEAIEISQPSLFAVSESLNVTEEFLLDALKFFEKKYGKTYTYKGKTIAFIENGFWYEPETEI